MPLTATVREIGRRDPQRAAVITPIGTISYGSLAESTAPSGGVLAVCLRSQLDTARLFVARCAGHGVTAVLDPNWPIAHRVEAVLAGGVTQLITDDTELELALAQRGWTPGGTGGTGGTGGEFLMLFSSGTTSTPKPIRKTRAQYEANLVHSRRELGTGDGVVTLAPGSLAYSLTLYALVETLATGGTIVLSDGGTTRDIRGLVQQHHVQRIVTVPAMLPELCRGSLDSVTTIIVGGAHLPLALRSDVVAALPNVTLISYYGAAEIGFIGEAQPDGMITPYPGVEVQVRGVGDDNVGELWVRTASASASATPTVAGTGTGTGADTAGWVSVGDVGRMGSDGRFALLGRAGDVITTAGHTVALPAVEQAFAGLSDVDGCCAIAEPDAVRGHRIGLVVEGAVTGDVLRAWARENLAPQFRPRRWYRVAHLPRTSGGKIRRGEALAMITRGEGMAL